MIGIYKIKNLINGKCYIGQSKNIESRWADHKAAIYNDRQPTYNYPLYKAMRKYGLTNFSFEVIEECSVEDLNVRENFWIEYYNSYNNGYNQICSGYNAPFQKLTKEQVFEIKQRLINFQDGDSHTKIANDYNVSIDTIQAINNGRQWIEPGLEYPLHLSKYVYGSPKKVCVDCGKEISKKATRCIECNAKYQIIINENIRKKINKVPLSRDVLKQLIRVMPFTKIGEMYNVTDNAIRKWCDNYNLPKRKKDILQYSEEEWEEI